MKTLCWSRSSHCLSTFNDLNFYVVIADFEHCLFLGFGVRMFLVITSLESILSIFFIVVRPGIQNKNIFRFKWGLFVFWSQNMGNKARAIICYSILAWIWWVISRRLFHHYLQSSRTSFLRLSILRTAIIISSRAFFGLPLRLEFFYLFHLSLYSVAIPHSLPSLGNVDHVPPCPCNCHLLSCKLHLILLMTRSFVVHYLFTLTFDMNI